MVCPAIPIPSGPSATNVEEISSELCPVNSTPSGSSDTNAEETSNGVHCATHYSVPADICTVSPSVHTTSSPTTVLSRTINPSCQPVAEPITFSSTPFWIFSPAQWSLLDDRSASQRAFISSVSVSEACWYPHLNPSAPNPFAQAHTCSPMLSV